jgi:hypothetical protein
MLTHLSLYHSKEFSKSIVTDHNIFLFLKVNQMCPLVDSIFKSNSTSLLQEHILEYVMNISLLKYMLEILYTIMNLYLKSVPMIFLATSSWPLHTCMGMSFENCSLINQSIMRHFVHFP